MKKALLVLLVLCLVGLILSQRAPCGIRYCPPVAGAKEVCALKMSTKEKVSFPNSCYMEAANDCKLDYEKLSEGACPSS